MSYSFLEFMELLSYVATVIGIPLALATFIYQEHKEREAEQEEIYDDLMEHYARIQDRFFEFPELDQHVQPLQNPEDARRQRILYEMLISLFERAFIMLHGEKNPAYRRMWNSWNDYLEFWIDMPNFRAALPALMKREDPGFVAYMAKITKLPLEH